jgi:PilZ domain
MPAEPETGEKRDQPRLRVMKAATIAFDGPGSGIRCTVRNISATGAALHVESQIDIPAWFNLVIAAEKFSKSCRVLWRKEKYIGVVFDQEVPVTAAPPLAPVDPNEINRLARPAPACIRSPYRLLDRRRNDD